VASQNIRHFPDGQAIMWDAKNRVYWGASEMREDGGAAGY
jgi:gamma-glutamyltranspeptidase/glutathione hydrolase